MRICIIMFAITIWLSGIQVVHSQATSAINCDIPSRNVTFAAGSYNFALLDYLNNGGSPSELESLLIDRNLIGQRIEPEEEIPIPDWARNRGGVYLADIDQNGFLEVIVSLRFTEDGGGIYIFGCRGDHYAIIAELTEQELCADNCGVSYTPRITFIGDMNENGYPEIVYDLGWSGVTTIWMDIRVGSWSQEAGTLAQLNRVSIEYPMGGCGRSQDPPELPEGTYEVRDINADGLLELLVQTGCSGSGIAAGPQRSVQLIFAWDGIQYIETGYLPDMPRYRLHAAYDAVYALNQFDIEQALTLYNRVLTDESLEDWSQHNIGWIVTSHALYGKLLSTIALYGNSSDQAAEAYQYTIQFAEDNELLDTLWVEMASLLWMTVENTNDLSYACEVVNDALSLAVSNAPPYLYGLNEVGYWPQFGYNTNWVPTQRSLSMCPF